MTVTAPPRPPAAASDPVERHEIDPRGADRGGQATHPAPAAQVRGRRSRAGAHRRLASIVFGRSGPSQSASAGLARPGRRSRPRRSSKHRRPVRSPFRWVRLRVRRWASDLVRGIRRPASHPAPISERRLTPAGLDLVRSGAVQPSDFVLSVSLPDGAWADAEFKPYAPSGYAVSFSTDPPTPALPAAAQTMLRGKERTQDSLVAGVNDFCTPFPFSVEDRLRYFVLSSQEASVLRETLRDGGWLVGPNGRDGGWQIRPPGEPTAETQASSRPYISVMWQEPILPQGGYVPWCGGGPF